MAKNLKKEEFEEVEIEPANNRKALFSAFIAGAAVFLICMGLCISYDLHQTKEISSEILPQMQADYEAKIAELNAEIELLQREFNKLKTEHLSLDSYSEDALDDYIDERLGEFEKNVLNNMPEVREQQLLQNNARLAALEKALANLKNNEQILPQEILLGSGALTIRNMAENGENFAYEAEVLQIMAHGNPIAEEYIAKIRKFSAQTLSTKDALIKDFQRIYADLSGTEIKNQASAPNVENAADAASWKDAFFRRLKNLVTFKRTKTVKFEPIPDAVYDLVESGNFAQALERMQTENKYALLHSPALEAWVHDVQDYIEFNAAVNGLLMNTLAHLHLKQFERKY